MPPSRRPQRDRRTAHRARIFFDGISALDIAFALLIEAIEKTNPDVTQLFLRNVATLLQSDEELAPGVRARLARLVKAVVANGRKRPH